MSIYRIEETTPNNIYTFRLNDTYFIGKILYYRDDEIAVTDLTSSSNCFFSPKCDYQIFNFSRANLIGVPFAFNGPCASLAGAGKIYNIIHSKWRDFFDYYLINQQFEQSPKQYLDYIYSFISSLEIKKGIIIGGNHLSALPLHLFAAENQLCTIIFDAHRDYNVSATCSNTVTHANFLNRLPSLSNVYLIGFRDGNVDSYKGCNLYRWDQLDQFYHDIEIQKGNNKHFYVDLDVDVIDPKIFPATGCPIPNGIDISAITSAIDAIGPNNIDFFSIEEYIPLLDNNDCSEIITKLVLYFILGWNKHECLDNHSQSR